MLVLSLMMLQCGWEILIFEHGDPFALVERLPGWVKKNPAESDITNLPTRMQNCSCAYLWLAVPNPMCAPLLTEISQAEFMVSVRVMLSRVPCDHCIV